MTLQLLFCWIVVSLVPISMQVKGAYEAAFWASTRNMLTCSSPRLLPWTLQVHRLCLFTLRIS